MSNFNKEFLRFSIILLLFLLVVDIYLRNINTLYKEKYFGLLKNSKKIEVLIAGNSHANYGVNPIYFNFSTFNIANVNQSIYFDKRIILNNIEKFNNLKYVLISIDYHSLYFSSQGIRDVWSYYGNGIKYKNKSYFKENISPFLFGYTPKVGISLLKKDFARQINFILGKKEINFDVEDGVNLSDSISNGFIGLEGNSNNFDVNSFKTRATMFVKVCDNKINNEILEDLEQLINELKSRNIQAILFTSPTFKEYNPYLSESVKLQNQKDIHYLMLKFNLEYWDYSNSNIFNKKDFYNCDHLNKEGAKKFSIILSKKLNKYQKTK